MKITSKAFRQYIEHYTTPNTRKAYERCVVSALEDEGGLITALVSEGGKTYQVEAEYDALKVDYAICNCDFDKGPVCPHSVAVLMATDQLLEQKRAAAGENAGNYFIPNGNIATLSNTDLFRHTTGDGLSAMRFGYRYTDLISIGLNEAAFLYKPNYFNGHTVSLLQSEAGLQLNCTCNASGQQLCDHQSAILAQVLETQSYRVFFDAGLRRELLERKAREYGLENEPDLDAYFQLQWNRGNVDISPLLPDLLPLNPKTLKQLEQRLVPPSFSPETKTPLKNALKTFIVFGEALYSNNLHVRLYEAPETKDGKLKNPFGLKNPLDELLRASEPEELKCYAALAKFQQEYRTGKPIAELSVEEFQEELAGIRTILVNPNGFPLYRHDPAVSTNITATSVVPLVIDTTGISLRLNVDQKDVFYEITAVVELLNRQLPLERLKIACRYFLQHGQTLVLIDNLDFLRTIDFLKTNNNKLIIHQSKFEEFRQTFLARLESKVEVHYSFIRPATQQHIEQTGLNTIHAQRIYLSDSENYVQMLPAMRYGDVEVPVLSKRQIYTLDQTGTAYSIERNKAQELEMLLNITRLHPDFEAQVNNDFFYLHKKQFLDEGWFLEAFELWNSLGYEILGFRELKNNRMNVNKMTVSLHVSSEIDWFDTHVKVKFGNEDVRLSEIRKSVANQTRYVKLGDGTVGLMPQEWLDKFSHYFRTGDLVEERIRTPKSNFGLIDELYSEEVLAEEVKQELAFYRQKVQEFDRIGAVEPPAALQATLRDYQKEGLNWLNFLDEFGFGGCLADDMGLGKTIQVIAFILKQREKGVFNTNLIVVPTSLLFNWQAEIEKFAPSMKVLNVHGANRVKSTTGFDDYEVVLTSYGMLLSDIAFLKKYRFNYIFLDESQAIKNPESQRYKAVRLLQSRNKIVLTGTPVENNTFDLYAQLSFAVPGLLGSLKRFRDDYAWPIDKFKDTRRAKELQQKINPFLLRRTKKQVAKELPEKTEIIVYCEMGHEQRQVYDTYKKEFQRFLAGNTNTELKDGTMHILQGLTKLRQICNSPALLNGEDGYYGNDSAKIAELVNQVETKAPNHKILVFSQFVGMLELIKTELESRDIRYAYLTGKTRNRAQEVEKFQTNDDVRVFLISLKAGGTGLNLTEADYVYIVDPWWNPAVENQAIDRCYRIGQQKNVMAVRLICPDTIEEKILRLQEGKKELVTDLIHTDASILKSLSRDQLRSLFD